MLQAGGCGFETRWGKWIFSIYLILPANLGPGVYLDCNRNEYQEQKKSCFWGVECDWCFGLKPYHHLSADCLDNVGSLTSHNPISLHSLLQGWLCITCPYFDWYSNLQDILNWTNVVIVKFKLKISMLQYFMQHCTFLPMSYSQH
jgi:hypothetical protein